jgi:hypothetical protein
VFYPERWVGDVSLGRGEEDDILFVIEKYGKTQNGCRNL